MTRKRLIAILIIIGLCTSLLIPLGLIQWRDYRQSDFFIYWLSGRLLLSGMDPYSPSDWSIGVSNYGPEWMLETMLAYPMPMALFAVPFGALPLQLSAGIWLFMTACCIFTSISLLFSFINRRWRKVLLMPVLVGILLYRPLFTVFFWGQLSGLLLFILILSALLINKGYWMIGAGLLPILIIKPQLGVPILGLVSYWYLLRRKWRALSAEILVSILITVISFSVDPEWLSNSYLYSGNTFNYVFGQAATIWGISIQLFHGEAVLGIMLGGLLVLLVLVLSLLLIHRYAYSETFVIFAIIICISLLITPYSLISDQLLLLIPMLVGVRIFSEQNTKYLVMSLSTIVLSLIAILLVLLSVKHSTDAFSVIVTAIAFGYLITSMWHQKIGGIVDKAIPHNLSLQ